MTYPLYFRRKPRNIMGGARASLGPLLLELLMILFCPLKCTLGGHKSFFLYYYIIERINPWSQFCENTDLRDKL
jgi:hypothetical protein